MRSRPGIAALAAALITGTVVAAQASEPPAITRIPAAELSWDNTAEGIAFAPLLGDRFIEPYMAMVQLPGGLVSPAHTKSANMYGVVLSGTLVHVSMHAEGSVHEILLPPGSFYEIPADLPHVGKCVSTADCVTFLYQDGKFDFLPQAQSR